MFDQAAPVRIFSASLIIIFNPDDVVFTEIASGLDLNQLQEDLAGIFQPVDGTDRDIDRFVLVDDLDEFVDGHARRAAHHDPVLGAVMMLLQREPASRLHDDALDLVTICRSIDSFPTGDAAGIEFIGGNGGLGVRLRQ